MQCECYANAMPFVPAHLQCILLRIRAWPTRGECMANELSLCIATPHHRMARHSECMANVLLLPPLAPRCRGANARRILYGLLGGCKDLHSEHKANARQRPRNCTARGSEGKAKGQAGARRMLGENDGGYPPENVTTLDARGPLCKRMFPWHGSAS